jgi:hypothetical protein
MTRQSQKDSERRTLDVLLSTLSMSPDKIEPGELPDFMLAVLSRSIGVEVTMCQSGTMVGAGFRRRQAESASEGLLLASREFRAAQADIRNVNAGLMFNDVVPARKEQQEFIEELAAFIRSRINEIRSDTTAFWSRQFTSPLMKKYLRTLNLRTCEFAEWYSSIDSGWVARPDSTLADIVAKKGAKTYRASDDLWLIIQCSHRISETVLPLGIDTLNAISMQSGPFSKIYLLAMAGVFQWDQLTGWTAIRLDKRAEATFSTFDQMKDYFINPELLADPHGWCEREVKKVLQEIRERKIP